MNGVGDISDTFLLRGDRPNIAAQVVTSTVGDSCTRRPTARQSADGRFDNAVCVEWVNVWCSGIPDKPPDHRDWVGDS